MNKIPVKVTVSTEETVTITLSEYTELQKARMGIDLIGGSLGEYGADRAVVATVCKLFGYEYKKPTEGKADA